MFNVNDYFAANPGRTRPAIRTKAGRVLSVQASPGHYCNPKHSEGPYGSVEVMVIKGPVPRTFIRNNGGRFSTDDVYGWVPVTLVEAVVEQDGGLE
jgi:hypothetical protein